MKNPSPAGPSFRESDSENENENLDRSECGGKTLPDRHDHNGSHPAAAASPTRNTHRRHTPPSEGHTQTQTPTTPSLGHRAHKSVTSATSTPIRALASILGKHPGVDSDELTLESKRMSECDRRVGVGASGQWADVGATVEAARLRRQQREGAAHGLSEVYTIFRHHSQYNNDTA